MSRHGPPGEYGSPTDPWEQGGHSPEGYRPGGYDDDGHPAPGLGGYGPAHHRGGPRGYEPGYEPGGYGYPGEDRYDQYDPYEQYDSYDQYEPAGQPAVAPQSPPPRRSGPAPPRPARRPVALYALVAALVLFAAVGVGYALFLLTRADGGPTGEPLPGSSATPSQTGVPDPDATFDNIGMNAAMARVDDCLVNDGSAGEPQLRIVPCDTDAEDGQLFQVLEIFDERVEGAGEEANDRAQEICADTDDYTHHYYEVGESESFVLCMAEHEPDEDD